MLTQTKPEQEKGQLIDVGGHRLYIKTMGEGSPTVVLEAGLGSPLDFWAFIQPEIAKFTQVCSYERAGLGRSDTAKDPPEAAVVAQQLHALLKNANIPAPYILVGHSLGGIYIRVFEHLYPDEVVGLVFVDASHPEQIERLPRNIILLQDLMLKVIDVVSWVSGKFGKPLFPLMMKRQLKDLPPEAVETVLKLYSDPKHLAAQKREYKYLNASMAQGRVTGKVGDKPVTVISASKGLGEKALRQWHQLHDELAALSSNSNHQIVEGATHVSLGLNQEHAKATVEAVRQIVKNKLTVGSRQ